jgi:hypothetical protein
MVRTKSRVLGMDGRAMKEKVVVPSVKRQR